jgi:hypothetical protein
MALLIRNRWRLGAMLLALLALSVAGCQRRGQPSELFAEASEQFTAIYSRHLDEAFLLAEMDEVEAKLQQVPKGSSDRFLADELLGRIEEGRAAQVERRRFLEEAMAEARRPSRDFASAREEEPEPPAVAAPEAPDAGSPHPEVGTEVSDLTSLFAPCFVPGERIQLVDVGMREVYELRDLELCRQRHPGYDQRLLVIQDGKVLLVGDKSKVEIHYPDAGVASNPDAGRVR